MPNLQKADEFFSKHLLKEQYFEFPEQIRSAAVAAAVRDITAALKLEAFPADAGELIYSAVFEQAIYLLLNPHIVTGSTDSAKQDIISPRAKAMLFERNTGEDIENGTETPDNDGEDPDSSGDPDSGSSGNTNSGTNTGSTPVINPSIQLHLYRG